MLAGLAGTEHPAGRRALEAGMNEIEQLALQMDSRDAMELLRGARKIDELLGQLIEETAVLLDRVAASRLVPINEPGSEDPGVC